MPKRGRPRPKQRELRRHFIKQWRLHRGLSQEKLAARVADYLEANGFKTDGYSYASIGRIENMKMAYTQPILEAIADALQTDAASLLMRNPGDPEAMWSIWDQAKEGQKLTIRNLAETIIKTGT